VAIVFFVLAAHTNYLSTPVCRQSSVLSLDISS
jgi:hypothetical protein